MATPAPSDMVKEREYTNWLKVTLALYYMKSGLHTFIQSEIDCLHQFLVQKIYAGQTVQPSNCTTCHVRLVKKKKQTWKFQNQCACKLSCDVWFHELLALHSNPNSEKIYWANSDISSWSSKPWECAKVFLPRGQQPTNIGPAESDAQALMVLLSNCTHFHPKLSQQGQMLTHTISKIRNKVIHDGGMKVSDTDRMSFVQQIIQLLEDPVTLKSLEDCKVAVDNIHKISNDSVDVFFNLGLEMTALRTVVNDLRQELGMQDKKIVDSVDILKEECRQLREQLTERFDDVEKELELYRKRLDTVEENVALHGERFGTVEENVALHGKRVDTVQKSVDSHEERLGAVEENVELERERLGAVEETVVKLQEEIGQMTRENNSYMKEIPTDRRPESDSLRQLKNQTEDNLDTFRKMGFIPTTQTEEVKKLIHEKRSVVIKGNPGEGKTSTALHLIDNDDYRNQRVVVRSPRQWMKVDTDCVKIVVLEDIFGQYDLDPVRLQEWIDDHLLNIQNHVDAGKLQVIITIRDDILFKAYSKLKLFKIFSSDRSLKLSSEKLKTSDRMSILNRELERNNKDMNVEEKEQCMTNFSGLIGFPQCCSLFAGDTDLFGQGPNFFKSPDKFLVNNITNLKADSFLSLAFLFCNGKIEEEYLSPSQIKQSKNYVSVLEELVLYLNISFNESTIMSLRESYDHFSGLYVKKVFPCQDHSEENLSYEHHSGGIVSKSCIQFSHATVYEAVGQVLGDRCPEMVVKYGDSEYLYQRTYVAEAKDGTSQKMFIPVSVYGLLVKRMIHDVVKEGILKSVVKHSALRKSQILMILKDELHKGNKIREFLMANMSVNSAFFNQHVSKGKCITFLQHILKSDEDAVRLVYSQFMESLACRHNNNRSMCWQCEEKQKLLELALYYHHFDIADKLITMNASYTRASLCNAARHGDHSRVQTILEYLKGRLDFNPECIEAKEALYRTYISGNQHVTEILLQEGITLDSKHVVYAVLDGDMRVLMKVVEYLKCHKYWNPHLEQHSSDENFEPPRFFHFFRDKEFKSPCSNALYITYCNERFDMADYLLKNEAKISLDMFRSLLVNSSRQAVARVMQDLKVTGIWDPHCDDASEVLQSAYWNLMYDVWDLLIQEGVSLKMKDLPGLICSFTVSLESVKKAIQHLKDTDSWHPKCDHATNALVNAFNEQMYDVFDLLVQEGVSRVSLAMKNLPDAIGSYTISLESVTKAIQYLKDAESWDPKCDHASQALEKAHSFYQRHDVCDLLIQEGVSLTMKHLPCMTLRSLDLVKTAVKQLKNTGSWDVKCNYASKALEKAYREQQYDVCHLLIQEGVSLRMKKLPSLSDGIQVSLESVKKALQHLKDTDKWDPKCNDASKALEKGYSRHKYDVCDLLVQEGVSLTMKNILGVIRTFGVSLESVQKAIQHLKDTDSWDPECNHASDALENAYSRLDVFHLLIQNGVSLTMNNLSGLINTSEVSLESVKKVILHLKDTGSWDPRCDDASEALEKAYSKKLYDVLHLLIQEGASLTMKNLPGLINTYGVSLKSVKKAIQHLKDTDSWDPKCDNASEALEKAYKRHDVFYLLIQEGVSLTMKNLPSFIWEFSESLEHVKKTIQYLKDTDSWNPKCDDAYEALQMAQSTRMHHVFQLLIQEGVSFTMKNLLGIIDTSLEFIKEAIKHLKDDDSWDPKCDDASKALEKAYITHQYDKCHLLIQEGVSLTMKNLPSVICSHEVSLEDVKELIQHLKDADSWDPKCDDASKALEEAYSNEQYDMCDQLIQEGVSLTMKNLTSVISTFKYTFAIMVGGYSEVSLESLQKAIQHLKDTDSWDPKCDHAYKALEMAYNVKKYDVCHLLNQEGVSLTMKNLPGFIKRFNVSLESVKEAIKELKETDSWDPKCDDASIALEKAYIIEQYDICHLFIQEGLSPKIKNLIGVISTYGVSLESVQKAIQHLKDADSWDPKCHHASQALEKAYVNEQYDVCHLLIQEGVSLTMKNFPDFITEFYESLESVKKVIQHLKDTDSWDPKCSDASEALEKAYRKHEYGICDLLVQEGVPLTMKHRLHMTLRSPNHCEIT